MSPLVAEVYGPDEAGRQKVAARVAKAFADTPDIVGVDTSLKEDAPRAYLRVRRQRAESLGIPVAVVAQSAAMALSGTDAAYLHDGQSKYPVPVRLQLPQASQIGLDTLLAIPLRAAIALPVAVIALVVAGGAHFLRDPLAFLWCRVDGHLLRKVGQRHALRGLGRRQCGECRHVGNPIRENCTIKFAFHTDDRIFNIASVFA